MSQGNTRHAALRNLLHSPRQLCLRVLAVTTSHWWPAGPTRPHGRSVGQGPHRSKSTGQRLVLTRKGPEYEPNTPLAGVFTQ